MRQNSTLTALALLLVSLGFGACSSSQELTASGNITDADGQTLYLEEVSTGSPIVKDSIRLDAKGKFAFEVDKHNYPTFYQLRLGQITIPFALDSIDGLKLHASAPNIFSSYQIEEGAEYNRQIQQISRLRSQTDTQIDGVLALYKDKKLSEAEARRQVDSLSEVLKSQLLDKFIFADPKSPAAFYALYQHKGQGAYFSVEEPNDHQAFAAVATAFDQFYPQAPYLNYLKTMALQALALYRRSRPTLPLDSTQQKNISVIAYPEIRLADASGKEQSLKALVQSGGKVLLSFTAYAGEWSPALVARLRQLKEQHPDLKIYEVSADTDAYYWKNASRTLPWVSVHDPSGSSLGLYNVTSLPTFYLIEGETLRRLNTPDDAF